MANDAVKLRVEDLLATAKKKKAEHAVKYRLRHPERVAAYKKAHRLANLERIVARDKKYYAENASLRDAYSRAYFIRNPDKLLAKRYRQNLSRQAKVATEKSIKAIRHDPDTVYRVVSRAVSSTLPRFMRDDVINSMLLAVLEGKLLLEHVGARMKDYVTGYNREYDNIKTLSLDAPIGSTDLRRIDFLVAPAPYEPEEDEEDSDMVMLRGGYSRW